MVRLLLYGIDSQSSDLLETNGMQVSLTEQR
jgi:hypothetical protein